MRNCNDYPKATVGEFVAFEEGRLAHKNGIEVKMNPYPRSDKLRGMWTSGWMMEEKHGRIDVGGDQVERPVHYCFCDPAYEPIRVIEAWGLDFKLGSALRYIARAGRKGGKAEEVLDLKKAGSYIRRRIEQLEKETTP